MATRWLKCAMAAGRGALRRLSMSGEDGIQESTQPSANFILYVYFRKSDVSRGRLRIIIIPPSCAITKFFFCCLNCRRAHRPAHTARQRRRISSTCRRTSTARQSPGQHAARRLHHRYHRHHPHRRHRLHPELRELRERLQHLEHAARVHAVHDCLKTDKGPCSPKI